MTFALSLPLNKSHVMEQLERLLRIYKRPQHAPADAAEFATDYAQICGDLSSDQFTGAVDAYLKGAAKWFPKPGELLALGRSVARGAHGAGSLQAQSDQWEREGWRDPIDGHWTPCPVCSAVMAWTVVAISVKGEAIERLLVLHNAALHWKAGVGFTFRALPGSGGGAFEHKIIDHRPAAEAPAPMEAQT